MASDKPSKAVPMPSAQNALPIGSSTGASGTSGTDNITPKRVIKHIVALDPKKLKALGIESNILSAMNKFNEKRTLNTPPKAVVKAAADAAPKPPAAKPETSRAKVSGPQKASTVVIKQEPSVVPLSPPAAVTQPLDSRKKVRVLSQVILHGNKTIKLEPLPRLSNPADNVLIIGKTPTSPNTSSTRTEISNGNSPKKTTPQKTISDITAGTSKQKPVSFTKPNTMQVSPSTSADQTTFFGFEKDVQLEQRDRISTIAETIRKNESVCRPDKQTSDNATNTSKPASSPKTIAPVSSQSQDSSSDSEEEESIEELARRAGEILREEGVDIHEHESSDDSDIDKDQLIDDFLDATKSGFGVDGNLSSSTESLVEPEAPAIVTTSTTVRQTKEIDVFPPPNDEILFQTKCRTFSPEQRPEPKTTLMTKQKKVTDFFSGNASTSSAQMLPNKIQDKPEVQTSRTNKRKRSITNYNELLNMCSPKLSKNRAETLSKISDYIAENIINSDDGEGVNVGESLEVPITTSTPIETKRRGRKKKVEIIPVIDSIESAVEETNLDTNNSVIAESSIAAPIETKQNYELSIEDNVPKRRGRPKKQIHQAAETSSMNESDTEITDDAGQVQPATAKGRRGRPKLVEARPNTSTTTANEQTSVAKPPKKRRTVNNATPDITQSPSESDVDTTIDSTANVKPKGKRGGKPKNAPQNEKSFPMPSPAIKVEPVDDVFELKELLPLYSKGRPTKSDTSYRAHMEKQLLLHCKIFKCGICKEEIPVHGWRKHGVEHYGVYWREGIDVPIDMSDNAHKVYAVNRFLKMQPSVKLKCSKCQEVKKSALGYLSHIETCGMDEEEAENMKVICEYCNGMYKRSSIQTHIQGYCPVRRAILAEQNGPPAPPPVEMEPESIELSKSGRIKRRTVNKDYSNLASGENVDGDSDGSFKCANDTSSSDDSDEGDTEVEDSTAESDQSNMSDGHAAAQRERRDRRRKQKREQKRARKMAEAQVKLDMMMIQSHYEELRQQRRVYYPLSMEWTQNFREINYFNTETLGFATYMPPTTTTFDSTNVSCLPLVSESLHFAHSTRITYASKISEPPRENYQWQRLKCFDSMSNENSLTLFCGGRLLAAEWVPLPNKYEGNQLLAICVHSTAEYTVTIRGAPSAARCFIQIWSLPTDPQAGKAKMLYVVDCEDGPVLAIEFCPSGGYVEGQRLGLLAIAKYDGKIDIVALPPVGPATDAAQATDGAVRLLECTASLSLRRTLSDAVRSTCTKICWSRSKGHAIVAGAYSDGFVAIWDLDNVRIAHMRKIIGSCQVLLPYQTFLSTISCITQLDLHHDSENQARWLLTGSLDRRVKLFDLENATPTEVSTSHLRSRIRSGYWPLHWNIHFSVVDDTVALKCGGLIQKQPLNLCQGLAAALMADGDPSSLAFNDWLNTSVFGTSHGDIFVNYFTQLLRGISSKSDDPKAVIGFTDVLPIANNDTVVKKPRKEFGLVFCDFPAPISVKKARKRRVFPVSTEPIMKINQVRFNPNENAYKTYAIGYENGLIRIRTLQLLRMDKKTAPLVKT